MTEKTHQEHEDAQLYFAALRLARGPASYTPEPGHKVRVRRYQVPCPELPGTAERKLLEEYAGTVASVQPEADGVLMTLEGMEDPIFTGYQFCGQDPFQGCSWSLQTEVIRAEDVAAHDQAEHDAQVTAAERAVDRARELWDRAVTAEVVARQRWRGARERLEAVLRGVS